LKVGIFPLLVYTKKMGKEELQNSCFSGRIV